MSFIHPVAGLKKISATMPTPQFSQHLIVETLTTETDSVHSGTQDSLQPRTVKTGRVHLQGDFRTWLKTELAAQS